MANDSIYENPNTGERVQWNGKAWVPMAKAIVSAATPDAQPKPQAGFLNSFIPNTQLKPGNQSWKDQAIGDIQHGTTDTLLGRGLHALGAQGTRVGSQAGAGELMEGPLKAIPEAVSGGMGLVSHPIKAANDLTDAAMDAMGPAKYPLAAMNPEYAIPGMLAQTGVEKGLSKLPETIRPDEDYRRLAGNAAGFVAGVKTPEMLEQARLGYWRFRTRTGQTFAARALQDHARLVAERDAKISKIADFNNMPIDKKLLEVDRIRQEYGDQIADRLDKHRQYLADAEIAAQKAQVNAISNQRKFDFAHQQGPDFQSASMMARTLADDNVPKAYRAAKASTDARWELWRQQVKDDVAAVSPARIALSKSRDELASGPAEELRDFDKILKDAQPGGEEAAFIDIPGSAGVQAAISGKDFIPVDDLRRFSSYLTKEIYERGDNVARLLEPIRDAADAEVRSASAAKGKPVADMYDSLKQDYNQFAKDWYDKGSPLKRLQQSATDKDRIDLLSGKWAAEIADTLGRYQEHGADPKLAAKVRSLKLRIDALKGGDTKVPPPPKEFRLPPPPEIPEFDMEKARRDALWKEFMSVSDPTRVAGEYVGSNPLRSYSVWRSLQQRRLASMLSDPALREFIASGKRTGGPFGPSGNEPFSSRVMGMPPSGAPPTPSAGPLNPPAPPSSGGGVAPPSRLPPGAGTGTSPFAPTPPLNPVEKSIIEQQAGRRFATDDEARLWWIIHDGNNLLRQR